MVRIRYMEEPRRKPLNNRLVTFLDPRQLQLFRELAYQRNQCASELLRDILNDYLDPKPPKRGRPSLPKGQKLPKRR